MKAICWNVNSIKSRNSHVEKLIKEEKPDILMLQELKSINENFPYNIFEENGYNLLVNGQKTYNGVAIASKYIIDEKIIKLADFEDEQARFSEISCNIGKEFWRIINVYVPNGQALDSDKFEYKTKFLKSLDKYLKNLDLEEENILIAGDFNIAHSAIDMHDPKKLQNSICCSLQEQKILRGIINSTFIDSFRSLNPDLQEYSWWDYRAGGFARNHGLRIDYIFTNYKASNKLLKAEILSDYRRLEKPSDHAPILAEFSV
jgi:exodeoxyribonuclease III